MKSQPRNARCARAEWILALAAVLAACSGTPPKPASVELPQATPESFAAARSSGTDTKLAGDWWRMFGDEQLDARVDAALQHNRNLQSAAARVLAANEQAILAGAPGLPQVDAGLDATRSRRVFVGFPFGTGGGVPNNTATILNANITVRWELDVWGRLASAEAASLADAQAAAADLAAARTSLVAQVCKAHFALVEAEAQLRLAEATERAFAATADDVRDRFRRGVRPALDAWQSQTSLASARADVARRQQTVAAAARNLETLLGRYPSNTLSRAGSLLHELPETPAGLPAQLLSRRPDLAAAERRLAASGCRVDSARAALYPRLSLTASGGTNSSDVEDLVDDDFRVWSLGANLLQPIFRGGALRAEVRRNEAAQMQAIADYGALVLRAFAEVENALDGAKWITDQEAAVRAAAEASARARDLARERYQLGLTDFLNVQDSQQRAFVAESTLLAVQRLRLDNRIDLILALGGGFDSTPPEIRAAEATTGDNP